MKPDAPVIAIELELIIRLVKTPSNALLSELIVVHIAFISQYFHPEPFSNSEIAAWLVEQGHMVDAFPCVPNYPGNEFYPGFSNSKRREEVWNGVQIHRTRTISRGTSALTLALNFILYPFAAAFTMRRKLRRGLPNVSFVSMPSPLSQALAGLWLRWRYGVPCVYWVQDIWPESLLVTLNIKRPIIVKLLSAFCGWIYRRADLILVQSEVFPSMIERFGVPADRIRVLPNTAPAHYQPKAPVQSDLAASLIPRTDRFRLMFAGNIGESQDFDTYMAAAEQLESQGIGVDWLIVGSGRDLERVQTEVVARNLTNVFHFLGRHPEADMPFFFSHADALLVGLKDKPIFRMTVPYKVQCYLACGKPLIGSLSGEGARVIEAAQCGITVPASSPEALAKAIGLLATKSDSERTTLGLSAREFFDANFSQEVVYSILMKALSDVVDDDLQPL